MLCFGLLPLLRKLLPKRRPLLLLDCASGKLLEGLRHDIHIPPFEKDKIPGWLFRAVLLECKVNSVFSGGTLKSLDIAVRDFNVIDRCILFHEMLD